MPNTLSGTFFNIFETASNDHRRLTTSAYVVRNVDEVFLSLEAMVGLRIVDKQFPTAGAGNQHGCTYCATAAASSPACKCLLRSPPPGAPPHLPMAPSMSNINDMKAWLLERYASSVFNKCSHQPAGGNTHRK